MAEFVKESGLNAALEKIFDDAVSELIIVSPYIKLHSRIKDILKRRITEDLLFITIIFGKNKDNPQDSFNKDDFDFFKQFRNIEIKYEERLHAKYYANDSSALLSSMNLYDYSLDNNIEFGILTKVNRFGELVGNILGDSIDIDAFDYFNGVINNSKTFYKRVPLYKDTFFGLKKEFSESVIKIDELTKLFDPKTIPINKKKEIKISNNGYCIRTGKQIPFNPSKPFSDPSFKSWNKYKDENFKEKYCHFSGEVSNGETSFAKPILKKNWRKSKTIL